MPITKVRTKQQIEVTADVPFGGFKATGLATPTADADAATKAYVDATRTGLDAKQSVRAASTATVTVTYSATGGTSARGQITAAPNTLDGVTLAANDRILLKDQTTGAQNGIWVVTTLGTGANGVWDRATDFDSDTEVTAGAYVWVEEGTTNADSAWVLTTNNPIIIGGASGTALVWVLFSSASALIAGAGLTKTANTLDVNVDNTTIEINADALRVKDAGVTLAKLANLAANSVIGNSTGSTATPTAVPMVTAATASAVAIRDANANIRFNNSIKNLATTATAAGTTTLTVASAYTQQFTGTTTQTVVLPDATTLTVGHAFLITNRSTGVVTVNANGGGLVQTMAASSQVILTLVTNGTAAGTWDAAYSITNAGSGGGTVTTVSVASANGFAGTVSNPTTTPAITLSTTITGILSGNGTAISAAATTGSGSVVLATSPSITTPALSGATVSTSATVTAGTNAQGQGALTSDYNVITTAASNPSGVTLPTATAGRRITIVNKGANPINVYPATGATIDALGANVSQQIPVNGVQEYFASSTTQWYSDINSVESLSFVTGTLGVANGGTGATTKTTAFDALSPMTTLGDTIYGGASGTGTRLAGNTTTTKQFLSQTGTGSASAAPVWSALSAGDIPALAYLSSANNSTQSGYFGDIFLFDDSTPSHYLGITNSANLTAARTLSINVNDANRTLSFSGDLTLANNFTTSGNFALTLTTTAATNVTLPTTGTLVSTTNYVVRETPSGTINGTNANFTLAATPVSGTEMVFVNGVLQNGGGNDYTISGNTITFVAGSIPQSTPAPADVILVTYLK